MPAVSHSLGKLHKYNGTRLDCAHWRRNCALIRCRDEELYGVDRVYGSTILHEGGGESIRYLIRRIHGTREKCARRLNATAAHRKLRSAPDMFFVLRQTTSKRFPPHRRSRANGLSSELFYSVHRFVRRARVANNKNKIQINNRNYY